MSTDAEPSRYLLAYTYLTLAGCIGLASVALSAVFVTWDPCSALGGVCLLILPTALGLWQYHATFHKAGRAATQLAVIHFAISAFFLLGLVATIEEVVSDSTATPLPFALFSLLGFPVLLFGFGGLVNLHWGAHLQPHPGRPPEVTASGIRFSLRELLGLATAAAVVLGLGMYLVRIRPPQYAEHVTRAQAPFGLPREATDICFCQGGRGNLAYKFTLDEESFRRWAMRSFSITRFSPITEPCSVLRYLALSTDLAGPDTLLVADGLHYESRVEDRVLSITFDRTTGRAYFYRQTY